MVIYCALFGCLGGFVCGVMCSRIGGLRCCVEIVPNAGGVGWDLLVVVI